MKKFLFIPILLLLCACGPEANKQTTFAMDTVIDFTVYGGDIAPLMNIVYEYDALFFPTRTDSMLSAYNITGKAVDKTFLSVLEQAEFYREKTNGAFDHTLGRLIDLWSFEKVPSQKDIDIAMGSDLVNLSAIAKGALSDALVQSLKKHGVESAIISLGGNIIAHGAKPDGDPWVVGIRDPDGDSNSYLATVSVKDKFVVSSGDYERYFEENGIRYHHILDAKTGYPAESDLRGVTIIAENGALADAYSTALFVMGYDEAIEFWRNSNDFEAIFVFDNKIVVTEGVPNFELTNEGYTYEVESR